MLEFHEVWGYGMVVVNALVGLYALAAWRWRALRGRPLWIATIAAEVAVVVQACTGAYLVAAEELEPQDIHAFYGFVAVATVAILYSYRYVWKARGWLELAYGLGGMFLMGLGIRAILSS